MSRRTITIGLILITFAYLAVAATATAPAIVTYTLDASHSKFMANADRSGLLWFKGKDHHLAASEFTGEVGITPQTITPASLHLVVKAASLHETGAAFTEQQKEIINKELREIVFHPDQNPDITFQSTSVTAKAAGPDRYEVKIEGNLTLNGVTRRETILATVTLSGNDLRAVWKFDINRGDYKVKATSAFHGMVRVSNDVDFEFDIVGHRQ